MYTKFRVNQCSDAHVASFQKWPILPEIIANFKIYPLPGKTRSQNMAILLHYSGANRLYQATVFRLQIKKGMGK